MFLVLTTIDAKHGYITAQDLLQRLAGTVFKPHMYIILKVSSRGYGEPQAYGMFHHCYKKSFRGRNPRRHDQR